MDSCNFGGLVKGEKANEDAEETDNAENQQLSADSDVDIISNWNLMYYLPVADDLQQQFSVLVTNYLLVVWNKSEELKKQTNLTTETVVVESEDGKEVMSSFDSALREFSRHVVSNDLMQRMVGIVHALQIKRQSAEFNETENEKNFPVLPGSFQKLTNPELEFVKSICHVLSLDTSVISEVEQMKKTILRIINIGEFSDSADYQNPSLSYVLREVICKECNYSRDVDLCRDTTLDFEGEELGAWKCTECHTPYDLDEIEMNLVGELNKLSLAFVLQDLCCVKCKNIKQTNMKMTCECSGNFTYLMSKDSFRLQLQTLLNVAKFYKMDYLREMVLFARSYKL